jgi:hypothetical protein
MSTAKQYTYLYLKRVILVVINHNFGGSSVRNKVFLEKPSNLKPIGLPMEIVLHLYGE